MLDSKLYEKKGQVGGAVGSIVTLIVGVGVSVILLIFVGALGGQTYNVIESDINSIGNNTATNQAFTANNATAVSLGHTDIHSGSLSIFNSTQSINTGNFTIDYNAGTALLTGDTSINGSSLNANYTWGEQEIRTSIKTGIKSGFTALERTGGYLPIIVLAVVISLVLTIIFGLALIGSGGVRGQTAL